MGDIRIVFDESSGTGDFAMGSDGDLETGRELETALLISLFTDAQADPGDIVLDNDPRGWWADTYAAYEDPTLTPIPNDRIGSKLWQIFNRPRNQDTLNWATDQILVCTNWMLVDGVASTIDATMFFAGSGGVGATIVVTANGVPTRYEYAWSQET